MGSNRPPLMVSTQPDTDKNRNSNTRVGPKSRCYQISSSPRLNTWRAGRPIIQLSTLQLDQKCRLPLLPTKHIIPHFANKPRANEKSNAKIALAAHWNVKAKHCDGNHRELLAMPRVDETCRARWDTTRIRVRTQQRRATTCPW